MKEFHTGCWISNVIRERVICDDISSSSTVLVLCNSNSMNRVFLLSFLRLLLAFLPPSFLLL
jgi:hypothetical protein